MVNGLERLKQGLSSLKPSEKKVAQYILDHPQLVLDMPIAMLAKNVSTSEATIIRMCRSLHINGFKELKLSISASLSSHNHDEEKYRDISANTSLTDMVQSVANNNIHSIKSTLSLMDEKTIKAAVDLIAEARKIVVIGVGASAIVALDFEQKLRRINKWCEALTDSHSQLTSAVHLDEKDVVIAISYSGETKEIVNTLKLAEKNKVNIVSLTAYGTNTVQKMASVNLFVSPIEASIRSGATASRIAQLSVIDILFIGIASLKYEESINLLDKTREAINKIH
ncbi:MurR/RpiR family transcriptional regulator [Jeotgalibacillus sp. JSM ZJ347]|uniref:MurR/RpiR family transcriptional regulator n=1 Tax=Jeotgalibacillus sp. JSM ZJ347 TaxID=3342117 RepID=UPI0035A91E16